MTIEGAFISLRKDIEMLSRNVEMISRIGNHFHSCATHFGTMPRGRSEAKSEISGQMVYWKKRKPFTLGNKSCLKTVNKIMYCAEKDKLVLVMCLLGSQCCGPLK